ncbi:hypothetical protein GL213_03485 [Halogeometricum borinquense]|uniref:MarR family transcriptional regulator n=1 Tax=Halogeometricum borinquense (strain ATCC 700274 / DSM 11551 / JCM 10706 / KCTC 4070 / PR3) TaxID=469382 RepID=E4NN67_HALBP|nr:hypothetical protein [Halogeometricum borinquense]ADQ66297.1 hypothetical protein Hbor_06990 [Halogeometricum borinquense DSM 11551]ELY27714.1 hypothetical protein C499_09092 [Halogeometricum borinquense DSM 11551]QIQ75670.1 hypothetical protein GL213_03485 [Halogeometricum borinquense]
MTEALENLREKDQVVLNQIDQGNDDVQKITEATTLENYHVTYAFEKLEDLGLLKVSKPEGTVERIINGQKRVFQHPKQAALTEKGRQHLEQLETDGFDEYENLSHRELVKKTHQLEADIRQLENSLNTFRQQVVEKL